LEAVEVIILNMKSFAKAAEEFVLEDKACLRALARSRTVKGNRRRTDVQSQVLNL
jgi:hypothetical protein